MIIKVNVGFLETWCCLRTVKVLGKLGILGGSVIKLRTFWICVGKRVYGA